MEITKKGVFFSVIQELILNARIRRGILYLAISKIYMNKIFECTVDFSFSFYVVGKKLTLTCKIQNTLSNFPFSFLVFKESKKNLLFISSTKKLLENFDYFSLKTTSKTDRIHRLMIQLSNLWDEPLNLVALTYSTADVRKSHIEI